MRPFLLSMGSGLLAVGAAWGQSGSGGSGNLPQIPFGQTYKDFQFPLYQNGQLSATLSAISAKGITINRAETTDLKIDLYTNGKVTTTITSPKADLYVADRIMRTKNTVQIERTDLEATSQNCDFDLINKKYLMRGNVRVILKNFDAGIVPKDASTPKPDAASSPAPLPSPESDAPSSSLNQAPGRTGDSLLEMPGAYASTNEAPIPPPSPATP